MAKERLIVIGNGMAGVRTVEEILARGGAEQFQITIFGDEPYGNYNRILLSEVLNGNQPPETIFLNSLDWYVQHNITLHAGQRVTAIDRVTRTIHTATGTTTPYDRLIIATGSRPFLPSITGLTTDSGQLKPGVFAFRTISDCEQMIAHAAQSRCVVVLGGGLLGLEAARGLLHYGCDVHVVHLKQVLMDRQLDQAAGRLLQTSMEQLGVHVHVNAVTTAVLGDTQVTGVTLQDGTQINCDMLVVAAGITPNRELAQATGLAVERAIIVDDQLRTSDPAIWAVGECAQHRGMVYGLVAPLWEQARVLADNFTGRNAAACYQGSKLSTKLKVMGVELASMGITEPQIDDDEVVQFSEPKRGIYKKLIVRNGVLAGAILLGDTSKAGTLMQLFDRLGPLPDNRAALLFDLGQASQPTVLDLPDSAQICNCNGVCKSQIAACVASGKRTLKGVMEATRAGTGCGACKAQVIALVDHYCDGQVEDDPSLHYYVPGVPLPKPALIQAILAQELRSVSAVFTALAGGKDDPASKPGLASLLKTLWGSAYDDERDARFINDRVHANIQNNGTFSVVPQIRGGVTTPRELRRIAEVAEKYNVPMVKITGGQRIDLLGIRKEDLPKVWADLDMRSGYAYAKSFRTCKSCVGTQFCRYGLGDSIQLAQEIEGRFQGIESPAKLKLGTAGCPRNCSEAYVKDVGLVAVEGGLWEIYVGGAAGAHVRKGDLLCTVSTHADALTIVGRFIQYYRENAKYLERTYGFVERLGVEQLRAIVVDDRDGLAAQLDTAIQASVDAYSDPWREAETPKTAHQFTSALPVIPLLDAKQPVGMEA
jgi:nitrite reductase (NADH) large subunit